MNIDDPRMRKVIVQILKRYGDRLEALPESEVWRIVERDLEKAVEAARKT